MLTNALTNYKLLMERRRVRWDHFNVNSKLNRYLTRGLLHPLRFFLPLLNALPFPKVTAGNCLPVVSPHFSNKNTGSTSPGEGVWVLVQHIKY